MNLKSTLAACAVIASATGAQAFDVATYRELVAETVYSIESGDADIAHLIAVQDQLIDIAVLGMREFIMAHPEHAQLMNFVTREIPAMRGMTLDEMETAWHDGEALSAIGMSYDTMDPYGAVFGLIDTVVDPVTAWIALTQYQNTPDDELLDIAADELSEVVEHLDALS